MKRKIRRRCKCGCGKITNYGKKYINGHYFHSKEIKRKISLSLIGNKRGLGNTNRLGKKSSKETRKRVSLSKIGNTNTKGYKFSEESKLKMSLAKIKYDPNYEYCDIWKDREYKRDLRKDYCENIVCKGITNKLDNHHIDLNKKNCHPSNIMTLCVSCHAYLHNKLKNQKFIIIIRKDHVAYINKKTRNIIKIKRLIL